jgi:hypothetical protein
MTNENLLRGNEIVKRVDAIKREIKALDEDYTACIKNEKNAWVMFDKNIGRSFSCKNTKLRQRCYEIIREELENEMSSLTREFETL